MRIAHVTATFPPYYAGTGTVCYHNALGLARLGHDVTVFTSQASNGAYEDPPEITVRRLPALFRLGNAPFLPGLLGLKDFDIVHLHHPFIFGAEMVWAACKARGIPYILTHHNDLLGSGLPGQLFRVYSALSAPVVLGGASGFAVVSLDHAANCRLTPILCQRWQDVVEIPNGVDADLFRPGLSGQQVRGEHGIPDEAAVIMFVGALDHAHSFKGVEFLIEAFSRLKCSACSLLIVGDGNLRSKFAALAQALEVSGRIRFAGAIPNERLPAYCAAADIVVLPSVPPESFGVVLVEAMACAKPVIASDIPGVRSVVSDGEDGLLVQPGDPHDLAKKLQLLLNDPDLAREMGARGRAKIEERYAWPAIIPQLVQVYEEVLAGGPSVH